MPAYNASDTLNLSEQKTTQPVIADTFGLNDSFDIRIVLASITFNAGGELVLGDGQRHNVLEFNYILLGDDI